MAHGVYAIESRAAEKRVLAALRERFRTDRERPLNRCETWYDTFDWRLFAAGTLLASWEEDGTPVLCWTTREGRVLHRLFGTAVPVFGGELPEGAFRKALAARIEMRRLLPVVRVERHSVGLAILDESRKTVARATFENGQASNPDDPGETRRLPGTLTVASPKGYEDSAERVALFLERELALPHAEPCPLTRALAAIGRPQSGLALKSRPHLAPQVDARAATVEILRAQLQVIEANEDGVRRDLDSEFLHDFRVAVRRTRSALGQLKGVLGPERIARFREDFKWLQTLTGPTRDLDVYLLKMPRYRALLDEELRPHLDPLEQFLREHQRIEQRLMVEGLDSPRYRALLEDWRRFLARDTPQTEPAAQVELPVLDVASERIARAFRKVLARGSAIGPDSPDEELHRLRIDCKKLRYLLEFFSGLYDAKEIGGLIKLLKRLQDHLGDHNDLVLQRQRLDALAKQMAEEDHAPESALRAVAALVDALGVEQATERRRFQQRFKRFATEDNRERARALFARTE